MLFVLVRIAQNIYEKYTQSIMTEWTLKKIKIKWKTDYLINEFKSNYASWKRTLFYAKNG